MASKSFGGTVKLTGESEYQKALRGITDNLKVLNSEMKVVTSQYDKNDSSVANLNQQNEVLNKKVDEQAQKVGILAQALADAEQEAGKNSATYQKWSYELNNAYAELNILNRELAINSEKLADAQAKEAGFTSQSKYAINGIRDFATEMLKSVAGMSNFGNTLKSDLTTRVADAKDKVKSTGESIKNFGSSVVDVVKHPTKLGDAIKDKLVGAVEKLENPTKQSKDAIAEFGDEADKSGEKSLKLGDIIKANVISEGIIAGIKGLGKAIKEVGEGFVDVGKQAVSSYAEYEQLAGGVDVLFGESSDKVKEFANNAFATTGLSANQYMETVTSFSASLISSLDGDTAKASEVANRAIVDMADNANKMGTDISSIQNAYQGFAKGQYQLLDNLKLGYGGTKTEMERLIADASKMTDVQNELGVAVKDGDMSFANIANAISVVQKNMGLAGATADEAKGTITGSASAMKSAWQNLVTGMADGNADFESLVNNLVATVVGEDGNGGFLGNMIPRIQTTIGGVVNAVVGLTDTLLPQIVDIATNAINTLVNTLNENLPALMQSASEILSALINGVMTILPQLIPVAIQILNTLITTIVENLPVIIDAGIQVLVALIQGISDMLPTLIPTIIDAVLLMVDTLINNIDLIIDAGIELLIGLADGLVLSIPLLLEKAPVIINKLVSAIANNLPKILSSGGQIIGQLVGGLVRGIPQLISAGGQLLAGLFQGLLNPTAIWNAVKGLFDGIVGGVKKIFGIHSPSTVFRDTVGANLALGLGEGFSDTMHDVTADMAGAIPTEFDTNVNMSASSSYGSNYDYLLNVFKEALRDVKVVMNNREMGAFVIDTVERAVYS